MRAPLFAASLTLLASGCVSFPGAHLVLTPGAVERVDGPVVCGPMGFRRTPLESKWGEYVRVTVSSPTALEGEAFVHANGLAGEPRTWKTAEGALVIESRFESNDPELPYVLSKDNPIDVTLTGLTTADGKCEGVVFTIEQGPLAPSIDEHAWALELERRGGAELEARRAARKAEAARLAQLAVTETAEGLSIEAALGLNAAVVTGPELLARGEVAAAVLGTRAASCGAQVVEEDAADSVAMTAAVRGAGAAEFASFPSAANATAVVSVGGAGCGGCTASATSFPSAPAAANATAVVSVGGGCGGCTANATSFPSAPAAANAAAVVSVGGAGCGGCAANATSFPSAPAAANATAELSVGGAGCGGCTADVTPFPSAPAAANASAVVTADTMPSAPVANAAEFSAFPSGCGTCSANATEFTSFPSAQPAVSATGHVTVGGCVTSCPVVHSVTAEVVGASVVRTAAVTAHVDGCVAVAPAPKAVTHVSTAWVSPEVAHAECGQCTAVLNADEWSALPPPTPVAGAVEVDTWAPAPPPPSRVVIAAVAPPPAQPVEVEVVVNPFEVVLPAIFDAFAHAAVPVVAAPNAPAPTPVVPGSNTMRPRPPPPPPH